MAAALSAYSVETLSQHVAAPPPPLNCKSMAISELVFFF